MRAPATIYMSSVDLDEDDPFEEQRDSVENPMRRLFRVYGVPNAVQFFVGVIASVSARVLDLLPPLMLGIAIDTILEITTLASRFRWWCCHSHCSRGQRHASSGL